MKTFLPKFNFFTFLFLISNLLFITLSFGQTIKTDLSDYPPGSTAIITGTGFTSGETITLLVDHVGDDPTGIDPSNHQPWTVVADSNGNVSTTWYVDPNGDSLGATFILTADGQSSGLHAEWVFTDSNPATISGVTISAASNPVTYGTAGTITFNVNATRSTNGNETATLSIPQLPTGIIATFNPTSLIFSNQNPNPTTVLTLTISKVAQAVDNLSFTVIVSGSNQKSADGICTITKKDASVVVNANQSKIYGAADPTFTGVINGFLAADNVTASYARTPGETVGTAYVISATLSPTAVLSNYNITNTTANFAITKKEASVTPNDVSKTCGPDPVLSGTLEGFLSKDGVTAFYNRVPGELLSGSPYLISVVLSPTNVLENYNITYNTAKFTITDTELPKINCPMNIILTACEQTVTWTKPTATDNCSVACVTQINGPISGSNFDNGTTSTITYQAKDVAGNTSQCSFTVTRMPELKATINNSNPQLYFGYSLEQSTLIKVIPSGGQAPYKVEISMDRPLKSNVITSTGDEVWTPGTNTASSSNCVTPSTGCLTAAPICTSMANITSEIGYSVTLVLMANTLVTVKVTDALGCSIPQSTMVYAEDTRCFAGNSGVAKVKLCHQTGNAKTHCSELCVDQSAVAAHLAHGDFLGSCSADCNAPSVVTNTASRNENTVNNIEKFTAIVTPNPSDNLFYLELVGISPEPVKMDIYDMLGRKVESYSDLKINQFSTFGNNLQSGSYIALITQNGLVKTLKLIKK